LTYFSFITLTTIGFGDITPKSPPAAYLAALEGLLGQLYLAITIARMVGLHITHSSRTAASRRRGGVPPDIAG
jgi:hypothetical protein